ncbi:TetR family transcriptional regulator [Streptomyces sp. NPDC059534]|uniref:TetR family transcriptional regulator n=1 Tax=Streptomyces sp. NPDC059534 TaxID=3346859 RepID=UPI0036A678F6
MRQERAVQTRRALIEAAGAEFDRNGYPGSSLSRVSRAAGVTMGALTFHFPAKGELADAVHASGVAATREVLRQLNAEPGTALQAIIDLTHALAQLLAENVEVRAAARLDREREDADPAWQSEWAPVLRDLLARARREGTSETDLEAVAVLATYLVAGAEAAVRDGVLSAGVGEHLTRLWNLALADMPAGVTRLLPAGRAPSAGDPDDLLPRSHGSGLTDPPADETGPEALTSVYAAGCWAGAPL